MHLLYCQPRTGRHSCIGALPTGFIISRHIKWNHMKSHRILSHHITSKQITSYHIISHLTASYAINSNYSSSHLIASYHIKLHHTVSYCIISYQFNAITSHHMASNHITSIDITSKQLHQITSHQSTSNDIKWHHIASFHTMAHHRISETCAKYCKVRMSCVWAMKRFPHPLGWRCKAQSSQRPGIWSSIWNSNIGTPTMEFQSRRSPTRSDKYPQISNNEVNRCLATSGDLCCLCCSKVKAGSCLGHLKPGSRTEAL